MIKILLDTTVLISSFPGKRDENPQRSLNAKCIIRFLEESDLFLICYSERTERELKNDTYFNRLSKYTRIPSHIY